MNPEIVVAYFKGVAGSVMRLIVGIGVVVAINLTLNPGLLRVAAEHRHQVTEWLDRFGPLWPLFLLLVAVLLLATPWLSFWYAQCRFAGLDASAILPEQRRELVLPLARDDAFAVALRMMQDDLALYAVQGDVARGTIRARANPLRSRSQEFGRRRARQGLSDRTSGSLMRGDRRPEWEWRVLEKLRLGAPARDFGVLVQGNTQGPATIRIEARMATLFPSVDVLGRNCRHVAAIAEAISAQAQALIEDRRRQQEQQQLQSRLLDAKLQVLRAQIEPHFLYNTLANVQYLVRNDPPAAAKMVGALIDYLRQALPRMRDANSTLGEEVRLVRAYLDVMRIRMGDRLALAVDMPAALSGHPFPPMMLLSLAENAIKHGLEPKPGGGSITLAASADAHELRIVVADDGVGFGTDSGNGIGLRNIRETLSSLYGAHARLTVEPANGGSVVATIAVPRLRLVEESPAASATQTTADANSAT